MDGSKPRQINFRMPNADAMRLDMLAQSEGLTTPDYVKRLVYAAAFPGEPVRSRTVVVDIDRGPTVPTNSHVAARMTKARRTINASPPVDAPHVHDFKQTKSSSLGTIRK